MLRCKRGTFYDKLSVFKSRHMKAQDRHKGYKREKSHYSNFHNWKLFFKK